jgi:hypothetical protein
MAWLTSAEKQAILMKRREEYEPADLKDYECPTCGWHASSHGESQYGLDCPPGGRSPAAKEGRLSKRKVKSDQAD